LQKYDQSSFLYVFNEIFCFFIFSKITMQRFFRNVFLSAIVAIC